MCAIAIVFHLFMMGESTLFFVGVDTDLIGTSAQQAGDHRHRGHFHLWREDESGHRQLKR